MMEDTVLLLPVIKDGVMTLGDLWDCRSSKAVGMNLFKKSLPEEHLEVNPINVLDYDIQRVSNTKEFMGRMYVSVELSLDCAGGKVSLKGKASFDKKEKEKFNTETLICNYNRTTFQVRLRPSATITTEDDSACSPFIKALLDDGKLEATHYVHAVTLGGSAQATISYSEDADSSSLELTGELSGSIKLGPVSASVKLSLGFLDSIYKEQLHTEISMQSLPAISSIPTSCEEVFKALDELSNVDDPENPIRKAVQFSQLKHVYGVPVQFQLMPLSRIFHVKESTKTYAIMKQEILNSFSDMIMSLMDYSNDEYFMFLLRKEVPQITPILIDVNHPLTRQLTNWGSEISSKATELKLKAMEMFQEYKYKKKTEQHLQDLITLEYEGTELSEGVIMDEIRKFGIGGRREIIRVHFTDLQSSSSIKLFSNEQSMNKWFRGENKTIKLLLQTGEGPSVSGVFKTLNDISDPLMALVGVEIGVAYPSISNGKNKKGFSLRIRTPPQGQEIIIAQRAIKFVIELFRLVSGVGAAGHIFSLYFSQISESLSLKIPFDKDSLRFFKLYMDLMYNYAPRGNIEICETYCQLLSKLATNASKMNIVCPIDGIDRGLQILKAFKRVRGSTAIGDLVNKKFYFCSLNVLSNFSPPLLFIFEGTRLINVCYDMLDVEILIKGKDYWATISSVNNNTLYVEQSNYVKEIIPQFTLEQNSTSFNQQHTTALFQKSENIQLEEARQILRSLAKKKYGELVTKLALMTLPQFPFELEQLLKEFCGWAENQVPEDQLNKINWVGFSEKLKDLVRNAKPYAVIVNSVLAELKMLRATKSPNLTTETPTTSDTATTVDSTTTPTTAEQHVETEDDHKKNPLHDKIDKLISFLADGGSGGLVITELSQLKTQVEEYSRKNNHVWYDRLEKIKSSFESFLLEQSKTYFHLNKLVEVSDQLGGTTGGKGLDFIALAKSYCSKVSIDEKNYPRVQISLEEYLNNGELFKVLNLLDSISVHPFLYQLHSLLGQFTTIPDSRKAISIIELMNKFKLNQEESRMIWTNSRIILLFRLSIDDALIDTIYQSIKDMGEIPDYVPFDISQMVRPLFTRKITSGPDFAWNDKWGNDVMILRDQLNIFKTRSQIPDNFQAILTQSLRENEDLEKVLGDDKKCLFHWDKERKIFHHNWSLLAVREALTKLEPEKVKKDSISSSLSITKKFTTVTTPRHIEVADSWRPITSDGKITVTSFATLNEISTLSDGGLRKLSYGQLSSFCSIFIPKLLFQLNTNNPFVLDQSLVYYPEGDRTGEIDFHYFETGLRGVLPPKVIITRNDLMALMVHVGDSLVTHVILRNLFQQNESLPLIVPNIRKNNNDTESEYLWLLPSLKCLGLFSPPYKFILTFRVGDTAGKHGRSSLINRYLLKKNEAFSSLSNPNVRIGKRLGRIGSIEIMTLNPSLIKEPWPEISQLQVPLLLGVLHGEATSFKRSLFEQVMPYVSCVVIFWHLSNLRQLRYAKRQFMSLLGNVNSLNIVLYPNAKEVGFGKYVREENIIWEVPIPTFSSEKSNNSTSSAIDLMNEVKLKNIMSSAIKSSIVNQIRIRTKEIGSSSTKPFVEVPPPSTKSSVQLLDFIGRKSLSKVKKILVDFLQSAEPTITGTETSGLTEVMEQLLPFFQSTLSEVDFYHLSYELNELSRIMSEKIREKIAKVRLQLKESSVDDDLQGLKLTNQIKVHMEEKQLSVLTLSNIIHATGSYLMRKRSVDNLIPSFCQNLFIAFSFGFPINIYDALENVEILSLLLKSIPQEPRVYVISIMGLSMSGKTTLLNHLYGASSPEYSSTNGVLLRFLWLEESLKAKLDVDAFLILDSEGISNPECLFDPQCQRKERQLITFLLSISDLLLINIQGEDLGQLPSVLASSLLNLLYIKETNDGIIPGPNLNIIHQQQNTTDGSKITMVEKFTESILNLADVSHEINECDLGFLSTPALKNVRAYSRIFMNNQRQDMIRVIPPLHDKLNYAKGVTQLRAWILDSCLESRSHRPIRKTMKEWFDSAVDSFSALQQFSKITSVSDVIKEFDSSERIILAKFNLAKAFRAHEDRQFPKLKIRVDGIFTNEKQNPGFDQKIETQLDAFSKELLRIPNSCQSGKESLACDECKEAFNMKDDLFSKSAADGSISNGLLIEDIERHIDYMRYLSFQRVHSYILHLNIKERKSDEFRQLVSNAHAQGANNQQIYNQLIGHLSSKQFTLDWVEQFQLEFEVVHGNLLEVIVKPLNPFHREVVQGLETVEVFKTDGFDILNEGQNKLSWEETSWIQAQLVESCHLIIKEMGTKQQVYMWGMGRMLKMKVNQLLELLKDRISMDVDHEERDEFSLKFIQSLHALSGKLFHKILREKQLIWKNHFDAVTLMERNKHRFMTDPTNFFTGSEPLDIHK